MNNKNKYCSKCKTIKEICNFNKSSQTKDGLWYWCKDCLKIIKKEYYEKNKERLLEKQKNYYEGHTEEIKQYQKTYSTKNKRLIKQRKNLYRTKNIDAIKAKKVLYYLDNIDHILRKSHNNYLTMKTDNSFKIKRKNRQYKRRALEKNAGHFTPTEWKEVLGKYGENCLKCGSTEHVTVDHVIPLIKGGSNTKDNLQPLCLTCNCSKGTKTIDYRI